MPADIDDAKTIAVIDGNSLMHRAFHAVPPTMNAPDGTPTNAVFGFLSMLFKFIELAEPDAIVCAFDAGKPAFRIEALSQYKSQRPPMDSDLRVQFPVMEEILEALSIPVVKVEGWEGDDILGTIAARNEAAGMRTLLVTGDKDACQLASELTDIVTTKKGITDVDIMSPESVYAKYGVTPGQFPDFLGLMGDSSDNIPGVPGIGAKTAAKFLQAYGSMEGLYEHLDDLKGKTLEKVRDNKDMAFLSRRIATIVRDLDFPLDTQNLHWPAYTQEEVSAAFAKIGMKAHLPKALAFIGSSSAGPDIAELDWQTQADAVDLSGIVGVSFAQPEQLSLFDPGLTLAVSCEQGTVLLSGEEAESELARIIVQGRFSALDVKSLVQVVYPRDSALKASVGIDDLLAMKCFDAGLAAYALDSGNDCDSLSAIMERYGGGALPEAERDEDRLRIEACAARMLAETLSRRLEADGSLRCYEDIDLPLVAVLAAMERTGAAIDAERLADMGEQLQGEIALLKARAFELAGREFNVDSPKQLGEVLFDELGLKPLKKTQRGYSTDAGVLKELEKDHELPGIVLRYRELAKLRSTYVDALPKMRAMEGDCRIHSSFNEKITATGRLSSSDPNLQNIPVRTAFGRRIRECFVPLEQGELFLSADYSQIELRLLAHLSQDEGLVAAFAGGKDFHAETAARVFGLDPGEVTSELRSRAKAVNFGIVYGQQAYGLAQSLDIPFGEAKDMIDAYFAAYPRVRQYLDETIERTRSCGYAETMFGRKRRIPELASRNANMRGFGERTAMNHPMQGSAADIIKLAMRTCTERIHAENLHAKLVLQVHDELCFSVPADELEETAALVRDAMQNAANLSVPLTVDVSWGENWAQAH